MNETIQPQDETQQTSYYFTDVASEGKSYLVVEDDFTYQPLWEKIIRSVDPKAKIRWCITAEGAEELIKNTKTFDFIIADILLSGPKTGIDLWKRFKNRNAQFIFASGMPLKAFTEMVGTHDGTEPYLLRKPLNPRECAESLRTLMAYKHCF